MKGLVKDKFLPLLTLTHIVSHLYQIGASLLFCPLPSVLDGCEVRFRQFRKKGFASGTQQRSDRSFPPKPAAAIC